MSYAIGSFSHGTTGDASIAGLDFMPSGIRFTVGGRYGTTETVVCLSDGFTDGNNQVANSIYQDSTGSRTKSYTNRCINHFKRVSGIITERIVATFVSFDNNGGGDYGFTVNFTVADSNYPIYFEAF